MIYKASKEDTFKIESVSINGVTVFLGEFVNEGSGNTVKLKTKLGSGKKEKKISLDILSEPHEHGPRIKVYSADDKSILMFTFPIKRTTGEIDTDVEKKKHFKENNVLKVDKNELRDFVEDVSRSSISLIMDFYNENGNNEKKDIIQSRINSLQSCKSNEERKKMVEKFIKEDK